ncbi:hypothetical protein UlMin_026804, partial [Ulmus minor]
DMFESKDLAIANVVLGLKEIQICGEIRTNIDYTIDLLHALDYRENKIPRGWFDCNIAMRVKAERPPWYLFVFGGLCLKHLLVMQQWLQIMRVILKKGKCHP